MVRTVQPLKLGGVQGGDGVRHAARLADAAGVDGTGSEVVGVSLEQAGHRVFADLNGVVVALGPVICAHLTSGTAGKSCRKKEGGVGLGLCLRTRERYFGFDVRDCLWHNLSAWINVPCLSLLLNDM